MVDVFNSVKELNLMFNCHLKASVRASISLMLFDLFSSPLLPLCLNLNSCFPHICQTGRILCTMNVAVCGSTRFGDGDYLSTSSELYGLTVGA